MNVPKVDLRDHFFMFGECDSPEKMIRSAIEAGAQTIGFSYPARTSFSLQNGNNEERISGFRSEIADLSRKYRGQIAVLLGEERDFYADPVFLPCDYIVGSVHFVVADDGAVCPLSCSAERIIEDVRQHFSGNVNLLIRRYFETVALLVDRTHCNYVADFDFLQKYNQENRLFDPAAPVYRSAVLDAMEALVREDVAFGIGIWKDEENTRERFSPSPDIVRWLAAHGARFYLVPGASQKEEIARCSRFAKSCGVGGFSCFLQGTWKT